MRRRLAHAKAVADKRAAGERIGLLVVSVHCWKSGTWFDGRPEVCRVVLPEDLPVEQADWSLALALDVLVCGRAVDGTFFAALDALANAGAASVWAEFDDGIWLMERAARLWVAVDGPFFVAKLGAVLREHRSVMMLLRRGFYGSRIFNDARRAILSQTLGVAL